jgi:hypothetical protein
MQFVLFTLLAVLLYFVSDRLLAAMEARAGRTFEHRSLVFFAILLALALLAFAAVRRLIGTP